MSPEIRDSNDFDFHPVYCRRSAGILQRRIMEAGWAVGSRAGASAVKDPFVLYFTSFTPITIYVFS
jgi:hypothetical protein